MRRNRGSGTIIKRKWGTFEARRCGVQIGTYESWEDAEKGIAHYVNSGHTKLNCERRRRRGSGSVRKTPFGRFHAKFHLHYIGSFTSIEEAEAAIVAYKLRSGQETTRSNKKVSP